MIRRSIAVSAFILAMATCYPPAPAIAQNPPSPPANPPPQPPPPKPNTDSAIQSAPDQPKWDPLRADKDVEVGKYYMNKGDIDAAIDRFTDALDAKPGFAIPYRFLGECYEKKGQKKPAVKAYQRYLDLYPKAEDGDKIRKKIEKLHKEIDKEKSSPLARLFRQPLSLSPLPRHKTALSS